MKKLHIIAFLVGIIAFVSSNLPAYAITMDEAVAQLGQEVIIPEQVNRLDIHGKRVSPVGLKLTFGELSGPVTVYYHIYKVMGEDPESNKNEFGSHLLVRAASRMVRARPNSSVTIWADLLGLPEGVYAVDFCISADFGIIEMGKPLMLSGCDYSGLNDFRGHSGGFRLVKIPKGLRNRK
jgi:hypothetical protein